MSIDNGPIAQLAWVTDDIGRTEDLLTASMGAGPWTRIADLHFGPADCTLHGKPADFVAHISIGYVADLQTRDHSAGLRRIDLTEFLSSSGPGFHHVCFIPDDFDQTVERLTLAGSPVVQAGSMAGMMRFAYFSGAGDGVPFIGFAEMSPRSRTSSRRSRRVLDPSVWSYLARRRLSPLMGRASNSPGRHSASIEDRCFPPRCRG